MRLLNPLSTTVLLSAALLSGCAIPLDAASISSTAASPPAAAWPTFHGPLRDNISRETGLLKQWPAQGPPLAWKFAHCGKGYAAVSVADGLLFTSGDFGDEEFVLALGMEGKLRWKTPNGKSWKGAQPGARTTPTCDQGMLYHLGPHGRLLALRAATGTPIWSVDIKEKFAATLGLWGYTENLLVDGDKVFCVPGGAQGRVVALNKLTGETIWANTAISDRAAYSSPIIAEHGGTRQLVVLARNTVFGVDLGTGKLLWSHPHESFCDQNVTSPIYHQGRVFVSSGHRAGARVVDLGSSGQVRQLWSGTRLDNCHGGVILLDGFLYGSGCRMYNKGLLCAEFETGKIRYQAEEIGKVSITHADGLLYCLGNDGEVLLVDANAKRARIISQFAIPRSDTDHTLSHPVLCGGRLYIRHLENLFAYDVALPAGH